MKPRQWQQQRAAGGAWVRNQERLAQERAVFNQQQKSAQRDRPGEKDQQDLPKTQFTARPSLFRRLVSLFFLYWFASGLLLVLFTEESGKLVGVALAAVSFVAWRLVRPKRSLLKNVIGESRGVQQRMEGQGNQNETIVSFRVERYDASGDRLTPIPVEMRGFRFSGTVEEGDRVQIAARARPGETLRVTKVHNLTTNTWVRSRRRSRKGDILFLVFLVGFLLVVAIVVTGGFS